MRRFLAILLLAMLPLQFSWSALATYCGHETQAGAEHFGHHEHEHHADTGSDAEPAEHLEATADVQGEKASGAMDLDCGHCHGHCSGILTPTSGLPGALATAHPRPALDPVGGARAPTRPERPQWLRLA